jgi:hypothetical protein
MYCLPDADGELHAPKDNNRRELALSAGLLGARCASAPPWMCEEHDRAGLHSWYSLPYPYITLTLAPAITPYRAASPNTNNPKAANPIALTAPPTPHPPHATSLPHCSPPRRLASLAAASLAA